MADALTFTRDATSVDTEDTAAIDDHLSRGSAFVPLVLRAIDRLPQPACIGLFGEWGSGKTHVLRLLRRCLEEDDPPAVCLDLQPWRHELEESPLEALVWSLAKAADDAGYVPPKERTWARLRALARKVAPALVKTGILAGSVLAGGTTAVLGEPAAELAAGIVDAHAGEEKDARPASEEFREAIADVFKELTEKRAAERVVVLVDDLDRCLPETMVAMLQVMRHVFRAEENMPATFVCALDRRHVVAALGKRFEGLESVDAERFLEKVFDLSLWMPEMAGERGTLQLEAFLRSKLVPDGNEVNAPALEGLLGADWSARLRACLSYNLFANPRLLQRLAHRLLLLAEVWAEHTGADAASWTRVGLATRRANRPILTDTGIALLAVSLYDPGFRPEVLHRPQTWGRFAQAIAEGGGGRSRAKDAGLLRIAADAGLLEVLQKLAGVRLARDEGSDGRFTLEGMDRLLGASEQLRGLGF